MVAATDETTYTIRGGVRRATAHFLEGRTEITAQVMNRDGAVSEPVTISLDVLLSPKASIDISSSKKWWRFERIREAVRNGRSIHPILVMRGTQGVRLSEITLDTLGETS